MYAVIRTGSKQYRVSPGDVITVEKLDLPEGKKHTFKDVLLLNAGRKVVTGRKELAGVRVEAKVISQGRNRKEVVFKYRPKKGYRRKRGHRQQLTMLEIEDIIVKTSTPKKAARKDAGKATEGKKEA